VAAALWEGDLDIYPLAYLEDHQIQGAAILPATAYIEAALAAKGTLPTTLEQVSLRQAIAFAPRTKIQASYDSLTGDFALYSRVAQANSNGEEWAANAALVILNKGLPPVAEKCDLSAHWRRLPRVADLNAFYDGLNARGLHYGPAFRAITALWATETEALAQVVLPAPQRDELEHYIAHPALLDACFQVMAALFKGQEGLVYVPIGLRQYRIQQRLPQMVYCYLHNLQGNEADLQITDEHGVTLAECFGLKLQALPSARPERVNWHYQLNWKRDDLILQAGKRAGTWLFFADDKRLCERLSHSFTDHPIIIVQRGHAFVHRFASNGGHRYEIDPEEPQAMALLCEALAQHSNLNQLAGIVYAWGLDFIALPKIDRRFLGLSETGALLALVRALANHTPERLYILTQGAVQVGGKTDPRPTPAASALWGIGRVISNEHPTLRARMIDFDDVQSLPRLAEVIRADYAEPEIALREGTRYLHRLAALAWEHTPAKQKAGQDSAFALRVERPGLADSLAWAEITPPLPAENEVQIRVAATALNFKDLMKVLNLLPDSYLQGTFFSKALGLECAGTVLAVGAGVTDFAVGDVVVAFPPGGGFQTHVCVPVVNVVRKPAALSFAESVVFINFVTAYYSLVTVGRLRAGETVLIHAATGGVGLAAVQIALHIGAKIIATAGSPEKVTYLQKMGLQHITDSRSLRFVDDTLAWTNGRGVDVVLNTLSGEALAKSFALLAPYGRFLEIGKKDITENRRLSMAAFDRNLTFAAIDLDKMLVDRPDLFAEAMHFVWQNLNNNLYRALPVRSYPPARIADAFRLMQKATHIGKISVRMEPRPDDPPLELIGQNTGSIRADATYLLTGGLGGFGLEVAKWLAENGAGCLVLVSRRGAQSSEAQTALASWAAQGLKVRAEAVDVSQESQVEALIERLDADIKAGLIPPLRGVIHSAMVLDDDAIINLNRARYEAVFAAKAEGAWHLHKATRHQSLDFFVMFSSVSAYMGNPRQANYVAANAFLDGLADYRRNAGLPALSIHWGSIAEVGAVARNPRVEQYLNTLGVQGLNPRLAAAAMGDLLANAGHIKRGQVSLVEMDWARWANNPLGMASVTTAPLYADLVASQAGHNSANSGLIGALAAATGEAKISLLTDFLRQQVAKVTRLPLTRLDANLRLDQLGIDSLMGVELNNLIRNETHLELSVMTLMQGLTLQQLAGKLAEKLQA
jgi:phthiocerol/phenolphthiocerol synthesis type-I polyketide synthase C